MLIINFSHPLSAASLERIAELVGSEPEVRTLPTEFQTIDRTIPMAEVARAMVDTITLTPDEWQTTPFVLNPPALAPLAVSVVAELHGRCGHFPAVLNVRPVPEALTPTFEVFEVMRLQAVRDTARTRR
jgi:hypothetical protein